MSMDDPTILQGPTPRAANHDGQTPTDDLEAYRKYVEQKANAADGQIILNHSASNSSVIVEFLFRKGENHVKILTSELNNQVYGTDHVIKAAIDFLRRDDNAHIDILSEKDIELTHPFFVALRNEGLLNPNRLTLKLVPEGYSKKYPFNFAVADSRNYRFEEDRNSFNAIVQFGDADFSGRLEKAFSIIDTKSLPQQIAVA